MIVALVSVELCLLTDSSLKVPHFAESSVALSIPLLTEGVCYLLVKQESTYRWAAGLDPSIDRECFLDQKT